MTPARCTVSVQCAMPGVWILHMRTATAQTDVYTSMVQTVGWAYTSVQITPSQDFGAKKMGVGLYSGFYSNTCNMAVSEKVMTF